MSSSRNLIGETLGGRYQVTEILGQGGMSAVYKAFDPNLQRVVRWLKFFGIDDPGPLVMMNDSPTSSPLVMDIMTGRIGSDGVFTANELLLKCPTKYEEAVPAQANSQ